MVHIFKQSSTLYGSGLSGLGRGRLRASSEKSESVIPIREPKPQVEEGPPKDLAVQQASRSGRERSSFCPVTEKKLLDRRSEKDCYVDFDTGKLLGRLRPRDKSVGRIDAGASLEADKSALLSLGMLVFHVDDRLWDEGSPMEILEKTKSSKPGIPIMRAQDAATHTYLFKTYEGGVGILQVIGVTDDEPQGIRIRYKLVRQTHIESKVRIAQAQIESLRTALAQYRLDVGEFPSSEPGLKSLSRRRKMCHRGTGGSART